MREEIQKLLEPLETRIVQTEREAEKLGARLDDLVRWRDPEKERPVEDDTILFWDCGAYVLGHFNPREETWTYYGPIRRYESKSEPDGWIPLPKPPKKVST